VGGPARPTALPGSLTGGPPAHPTGSRENVRADALCGTAPRAATTSVLKPWCRSDSRELVQP
jgi:hypothetical protein